MKTIIILLLLLALPVKAGSTRTFTATAYCHKGKTFSGKRTRKGFIAADRRIYPIGTKIRIIDSIYSGIYTVEDTGGAIKGDKLDIWMPCSETRKFGRRKLKGIVYALGNTK